MYRIDGIYNSGYAHAPALIVNPSGSYPLIYNSTTGILQQTPNDQKVDKASDVEFKSVKTTALVSSNGTVVVNYDDGVFVIHKPLYLRDILKLYNLLIQKEATTDEYLIRAGAANDTLQIYGTKGVKIGISSNYYSFDFRFEPGNNLLSPSFRIPNGASMWTSKIDSLNGTSAITIADNGLVTIPNIGFSVLKIPVIQSTSGVNALTIASDGKVTAPAGLNTDVVRAINGVPAINIDQNGSVFIDKGLFCTGGVAIGDLLIQKQEGQRYAIQAIGANDRLKIYSTRSLTIGVNTSDFVFEESQGAVATSFRIPSNAALWTPKIMSASGTQAITIDNSGNVSIPSLPFKVLTVEGSGAYPILYDSATGLLTQTPINQFLNTSSVPYFSALNTVPVGANTRAPIRTSSSAGYSSSAPVYPADLDVYDLNIRTGNIYTTGTTLATTSRLSIGKTLTINSFNGTSSAPYASIIPGLTTVPLWLGAGGANDTLKVGVNGVVQINKLEVTNALTPLKVAGGIDANFEGIISGNIFTNRWFSNPVDLTNYIVQAVASPTGPKFENGLHTSTIKHPLETKVVIDFNGTNPSFPEGLKATLPLDVDGSSVVTYNTTTQSLGYKASTSTKNFIRFAPSLASFLNSPANIPNKIQTYYILQDDATPRMRSIPFSPTSGYPPVIEYSATLLAENYRPNIFFSFESQIYPAEQINFPNTWDGVRQKFPSLGTYMITWNIGSFYDPRKVLISINKNFLVTSPDVAGNSLTALATRECYQSVIENGIQVTALVNITQLTDYVTYSIYNYDGRTFLGGQNRNSLSIVKVA